MIAQMAQNDEIIEERIHCQGCEANEDNGIPGELWIACDGCGVWSHALCIGWLAEDAHKPFQCDHCKGHATMVGKRSLGKRPAPKQGDAPVFDAEVPRVKRGAGIGAPTATRGRVRSAPEVYKKKPLEYFALVSSCAMVADDTKYRPEELALGKGGLVKHFQLGQALCVARINADAPLAEAKALGWGHSPWAHGPYVYHIDQVYLLREPVPVKGNLGAFRLLPEARASIVAQLPPGLVPQDEDLRGLSVKQPWLKRIMYEGKDVENRTRRIFTTVREVVLTQKIPPFEAHMKP